jgi:hypothetical protein
VEVSAPGFRSFKQTGIELNVNDRLNVNAKLQVGTVSEVVNVEAAPLQVDTETPSAEGLINGLQVRELALSARNYEEMVALTPGVSSAVSDTIYVGVETPGGGTNQVSFSINGNRFSQNNWTIDGADNVDRGGNFSLLNYPSVDAIDEFKVMRSMYNPEYGRAAGGQISVITRSGTNKFHGGLYEFFRNDALNANRFMNNFAGVPRPILRYNDFGWTFGGPIYIPGHYNTEKNKTFFFYSEELRRVITDSTSTVTVPNGNERQGIFSSPVCFDPACATQGTVIPQSSFNPAAVAYLKDVYSQIPLPQNSADDQLIENGRNVFNYRQEIIRVDHTFSPKLTVTGRWMNDSIPTINPAGLFGFTNILGYATTTTNSPGRNFLIRGTMQIRPTLINDLAYSYSYGAIISSPIGTATLTNSPDVVNAITLPFPTSLSRIPNLDFQNGDALSGFGPYRDFNRDHNWMDNLLWVHGKHTFKFGASYHRYQKSENDAGGFTESNGGFVFNSIDPSGNSTFQQEWASFLLGQVNTFSQANKDFRAEIRQQTLELYAQDEYRLKRNLTMSYGVRYTLYHQPTDANNQNTSFLPSVYNPGAAPTLFSPDGAGVEYCLPATQPCTDALTGVTVFPNPNFNPINGLIVSDSNTAAIAAGAVPSPFGGAVMSSNTHNFAPRLGFAWDPWGDGKTSIRTGFGIFFDAPAIGFVENNEFINPPFVTNVIIANTIFNNPGVVAPSVQASPITLRGVAPNWHLPYVESFSLDVQRELPHGIILDVGYYGNVGRHLLGIEDINQPPAGAYIAAGLPAPLDENNFQLLDLIRPFKGYGPINESVTIFTSNYHSLQANMQKRFKGGSQIGISYTWSHALTTAGNDASAPQNNADLRAEYGPADFDRRHIFKADFVYEFPWMRDQQGFLGHVLGGWEFSGIITYNSGLYLTALGSPNGTDPAGLGLLDPNAQTDNLNFTPPQRPDQIGDPNAGAPHTVLAWFNTAAFVAPTTLGVPGNAPRGSIKGPGIERWDLSLFKNFKVTEGTNFQFRLESFNVFNHTNFDQIDQSTQSGTFGQVLSTHEPRIVQLGLKFNF